MDVEAGSATELYTPLSIRPEQFVVIADKLYFPLILCEVFEGLPFWTLNDGLFDRYSLYGQLVHRYIISL